MKVKLLFKIDRVTPDKLPGAELAEYMVKLARMLGARDHVHFTAIRSESTGIEAVLGYGGRTEVRKRMRNVQVGIDPESRRYFSDINGMLARRKLSAKLQEISEDKPPVVRVFFPGGLDKAIRLPTVRDQVEVIGILYRLEGRDKTVHAGLQYGEHLYSILLSREQAISIAPHLFKLIHVVGEAPRSRNADGKWEMGEIVANRVEAIEDVPLISTIDELRSIGGLGWAGDGGLNDLQRLREDQ